MSKKSNSIYCSLHGDDQYGYIVCNHLVEDSGLVPSLIEKPNQSPDGTGTILCKTCAHGASRLTVNDLKLICEGCARRWTEGLLIQ